MDTYMLNSKIFFPLEENGSFCVGYVVRPPWTDGSAEVQAGRGGMLLKDPLQVVRESD